MAPMILNVINVLLRTKRRKPRRIVIVRNCNKHRNRGWLNDAFNELSEFEFTRMFRLNRVAFDDLLTKITDLMPEKDEKKAIASSGSVITNKTRLAITLRWLAGASYLDLMWGFRVSRSTIYHSEYGIIYPTIEAINTVLTMSFPYDDTDELERISGQFAEKTHHIFEGIVGAIDGLVIKTRQPKKHETSNPVAYRNRKGTFGVLCLGVSDIKGKFLSFSCNWSGSTHDSFAYQTTRMFHRFEVEGSVDPKYYLIGDEAFVNTNRMLVPWGGRNLHHGKDSFNYHLSKCRSSIERAFGMMVKRFGILWRKLDVDYKRWPQIATVCAKLHNLCCDHNIPDPPRLMRDIHQGDRMEVILDDEEPVAALERGIVVANIFHARGDKRKNLTQQYFDRGIGRPPLPGRN